MGLTIHYSLTTALDKPQDVRKVVEALRQFALDLPFEEVGEVKEFKGEETSYRDTADETEKWLKIQATGHLPKGNVHYDVQPRHIIAFSTWPGQGCEAANFGFNSYPAFLSTTENGRKRRLATKLKGWSWHSFCKTQYASDPRCGGVQNFLRCHLCVVKLLDFIKQTGMVTVEVSDEGDYWEKRDVKSLAQEVGQWNEFIAGFSSVLRSAVETQEGVKLESAITGFPNFEHLKAKGLEKLAQLKRAFGAE